MDRCLLNAHESVDNRLTVNPVLIKFQSSVNRISFRMSLGEQSICQSRVLIEDTDRQIFTWCTWISWHSADCQPGVDQVSNAYWSGCPSSNDQDVNRGYWSRIWINTRPQMPLAHMIPKKTTWNQTNDRYEGAKQKLTRSCDRNTFSWDLHFPCMNILPESWTPVGPDQKCPSPNRDKKFKQL